MGGICLKHKQNGAAVLHRLGELIASSMIVTLLSRFGATLYRKLSSGLFGGMFTGYDRCCEAVKNSAAARYLSRLDLAGRFFIPMKRTIARGIENSVILQYLSGVIGRLLTCSMKVYGIFMFSATLYSAIFYLFNIFYFMEKIETSNLLATDGAFSAVDPTVVLTLVLMLIASVVMIASRHTLLSALAASPLTRFVLLEIVGIRRESLDNRTAREGRFNIAFIAGLIYGLISMVTGPLVPLILIVGAAAALLVLTSPEFGVVAIITVLPFAPTMGLVAAVLYTALCYFLKILQGKRSVRFDLLDGMVLLFLLLMVSGGIVAASTASIKPMLVYVAFMVGYFLVVNLIRSPEWMRRCLIGVVASCTLVGLYGLYQNFSGLVSQTWQDSDMFSTIEGRVVSTFENPNVLAEYLIMVLPLVLALFLNAENSKRRLATVIAGGIIGGCLIYTWSRGAWLGFLIGIAIFLLMYSRHTMTFMLFGCLGIPFLPFVLPESITQRFLSIGNLGDSSTSYRVNIWRGVGKMVGDYWQTGIGIGTDSFRCVYPLYSLSGIESAPHSHNLYLQILVEIGIVGLLAFLVLLFFWTQSCFTIHRKEERREKLIPAAIFCGLLSVLAQGMTDYIWYNYRVFLMFWLMLGLCAAARKILTATAGVDEY